MQYDATQDQLTPWGRDKAAPEMVLSFRYDMTKLEQDTCEALARPVAENSPDSTIGVQDLLELDLAYTMVTPHLLMRSSLRS